MTSTGFMLLRIGLLWAIGLLAWQLPFINYMGVLLCAVALMTVVLIEERQGSERRRG